MIERYKSGFLPPEDFPFEDLSRGGGSETGSTPSMNNIGNKIENNFTVKGTISGGKLKKRGGLFNIFNSNKVSTFFFIYFRRLLITENLFRNLFTTSVFVDNISREYI